jgi:hypothetical protein
LMHSSNHAFTQIYENGCVVAWLYDCMKGIIYR